jgi:dihydrofolate reductase
MNATKITLIAAMAKNRVIGLNGKMPWHCPEDLQHFKSLTLGKTIIMGRKTFDSLGRLLPQRKHIVLSRQSNWQHEGVTVVANLLDAIALCKADNQEAFVIGGGQVYQQALALADRLQLTFIDLEVAGDTVFPEWPAQDWQETQCTEHVGDNGLKYAFVTFERV